MARKTRIPKQCADKKESSAKRKSLGKRKSFAKKELQNSYNSHDDLWLLMTLFCDSHSMRSSLCCFSASDSFAFCVVFTFESNSTIVGLESYAYA